MSTTTNQQSKKVYRGHKIELDPTPDQVTYFCKAVGTARYAYNWALAEWKTRYDSGDKKVTESKLRDAFTEHKKTLPWAREVAATATSYAIKNLGDAYDRFFKKQASYPRFKKKFKRDTYRVDDGKGLKLSDDNHTVYIPKLGNVRLKEKLRFNGRVIEAVISRRADKWFIGLCVETNYTPTKAKNQGSVGVDLGIKTTAYLSDNTTYHSPRSLQKHLKRIKRLNRVVSRRKRDSGCRNRAKLSLARLHYKISCIRQDFLHKLTSQIVNNYQTVVIEDLSVKDMLSDKTAINRAISDIGFHEFRRQITYKCKWNDRDLIVADKFYPSSKTCNVCKAVKSSLLITDRIFKCDSCGLETDRDLNAAINLNNLANNSTVNYTGINASGDSTIVES